MTLPERNRFHAQPCAFLNSNQRFLDLLPTHFPVEDSKFIRVDVDRRQVKLRKTDASTIRPRRSKLKREFTEIQEEGGERDTYQNQLSDS